MYPGHIGSQGEKVSDEGAGEGLLVTAWQSEDTSTLNTQHIRHIESDWLAGLTLVGRAESDERSDVGVVTQLGQTSEQEPALGQTHSVVASLEARVPSHDLTAEVNLLHHPAEDAVVLVRLQGVPQPDGEGVDVLREGGEEAGTAVRVVIEAVPAHHGGPQAGGEAGQEEAGQAVEAEGHLEFTDHKET